jgi:DNA-binding beta-propeller fold protein YncE
MFTMVGGKKLRMLLTISLLLFALSMNGQSFAQQPKETHPATAAARTVLAVQEGPGRVVLFSASAPAEKATIAVREKPHEIELTPDGRTAFVTNFGLLEVNHKIGTPGSTISVLDVTSGSVRSEFRLPAGHTAPHGVKLRPPLYKELFTNAEEGAESMVVFHAETGAVLRVFALPPGVHNFVFDPDGTAIYAFTMTNTIVKLDPQSGAILGTATVPSPRGLAWTTGATHLIVGTKNELLFLNPSTLAIDKRWGPLGVGQVFYPTASSDGKWIFAPAVLDGVVLVIDASTGAVAHRIQTGSPLQVIEDGNRLWISNVLVPPAMLPKGAAPRRGGIVALDRTTWSTTPLSGIEDTNGLAVSKVATTLSGSPTAR